MEFLMKKEETSQSELVKTLERNVSICIHKFNPFMQIINFVSINRFYNRNDIALLPRERLKSRYLLYINFKDVFFT